MRDMSPAYPLGHFLLLGKQHRVLQNRRDISSPCRSYADSFIENCPTPGFPRRGMKILKALLSIYLACAHPRPWDETIECPIQSRLGGIVLSKAAQGVAPRRTLWYFAGGTPRRTPLRGKIATYGWTLT